MATKQTFRRSMNIPFTVQPFAWLLYSAPVIILKILSGFFQYDSRSCQFPRMVAKELLSQLVFFIFDFHGLKELAGFFIAIRRPPFVVKALVVDLGLGGFRDRPDALAQVIMLDGLMTNNNLCWRYVTDDIDPFRQPIYLCAGLLSESSLSDSKSG